MSWAHVFLHSAFHSFFGKLRVLNDQKVYHAVALTVSLQTIPKTLNTCSPISAQRAKIPVF